MPGRFKCNVNASFSEGLNRVGIGVCIRDDQRAFVLGRIEWFLTMLDVDIDEALGLLKVMEWVNDEQLLGHGFCSWLQNGGG